MKVYAYLILIMAIIMLCGCNKKQNTEKKALEKVTVTLDWTPNTNHTGLYVAQDLGYFKQAGLDVKIVQPAQVSTDQIVGTGKSEFGISYQENVIRARSETIPIVSIAAIIQHNTSGFASLKKDNITSPQNFTGKRYGSWDSPSELAILKAIMQKNKLDYNRIKVISGVTDFFSTIGKDADFEWIYYAWDGIEAKNRGIDINYIPLRELDPVLDYYTPVIITNESLIQNNPDLIKRFMEAVVKGYQYCIKNPHTAAQILLKYAPELKPQLVENSQAYLANEYQAESAKWGFQKAEVWKNFSTWMFDQRLINQAIITEEAYTNKFLP